MLKSEMQDRMDIQVKQITRQAVTILNLNKKVKYLEDKLSAVKSHSVDICVLLQEN